MFTNIFKCGAYAFRKFIAPIFPPNDCKMKIQMWVHANLKRKSS